MSSVVMTARRTSSLYVLLLLVAVVAADEACNVTKCRGPLKYYNDLGCKPIYENEGDCCAIRYDCDHLKGRNPNKCYVNENEYSIGEQLKPEDANPCDIGCTCTAPDDEIAAFTCAIVDCFHSSTTPGCYKKMSPYKCCSGPEVCPEKPEDRATCVVDGKTYKDGEAFSVPSDPKLRCYCQPGYTGENVAPFCAKLNREYCNREFRHADEVRQNCAPVFYETQNPQTSCSVYTRCQNSDDTVISHRSSESSADDDYMCTFGNLTMHRGDTLNEVADYGKSCIKCVCEVGPLPTCQRVRESECDFSSESSHSE